MTKNKKVPALRFPGFEGEWEVEKLEDYLEEFMERVPASTELPILTSSRSGLFLQKDYFNDREVSNDGEYRTVPYGYITYRHMSDDSTFFFNINKLVEKGAVSKEYPVFSSKSMDIYFLQQSLNFGNAFKKYAIEQKRGGTRTRLYFKTLVNLRLPLPTLPEQQKIAAFLSAVDARIQQLTRKKALLEQYKKGVMQQIFSRELRFRDEEGKEFPEWEVKRLKDVTEIKYGKDQKGISSEGGKYPIFGTGGELGRTNRFLFDKPSVLIGRKGTIDKPRYLEEPFWTVDTLFYTEPFKNVNVKWLYYMFETIDWYAYNEASGVPSLSASTIYRIKILLPTLPEQQKIATFLSAIDAKISRVGEQIERTQAYKKGLLQQMFV